MEKDRSAKDSLPLRGESVVEAFRSELQSNFSDEFDALYLTGSIALDDYHEGKSDIDFVAILSGEALALRVAKIKSVHQSISRKYLRPRLNGIYVQRNYFEGASVSEHQLVLVDGNKVELIRSDHLRLTTLLQVRDYSLKMFGPDSKSLNIRIDGDELLNELKTNLSTYWTKWASRHSSVWSPWGASMIFFPRQIEWCVLGVSRIYSTIQTGKVVSKTEAGEFCLTRLESKWYPIVRLALSIRKGSAKISLLDLLRARSDAIAYMRFVISTLTKS